MSRRRFPSSVDARWWLVMGTVVSLGILAFYLLDPQSGADRRTRMASHLKPRPAAA
jgi:hypothetical protein